MSYLRYIDCDNNYESLLSLLKQTIVEDDAGNWWVRVVAADPDETPVSILTEIECGEDWISIQEILKNLLVYDDDGNLAWAVYNSE
jgi:hypothetical protein